MLQNTNAMNVVTNEDCHELISVTIRLWRPMAKLFHKLSIADDFSKCNGLK
jgi:hypothetical protein